MLVGYTALDNWQTNVCLVYLLVHEFLLYPLLYEPYILTFRELHICEQVLWPNGTYNDSYLDNSTIAVTMDISSKFTVKVPYSGKHW